MTIPQIITTAKISQYLASQDAYQKRYLNGVNNDGGLARLIYMVRRNVEYIYNVNPTDTTLYDTADYLYALCGQYAVQAQTIQGNVGGYVITSTNNNLEQLPVSFKVGSGLNHAPNDGDSVYVNPDIAGWIPKYILSASVGYILNPSIWTVRKQGGFNRMDGSTFGQDEEYTLIF